MKKKSFHITIDEPCGENWQNMLPNADGKFCLHCSKTVVDFTQQTSYEIKSYFRQNEGNTCGRFTKQQLGETYNIYEASKFNHYKFVASLAIGLLTLETLNAFSIDGKDFKNEKDSVQILKMIGGDRTLDSPISVVKIGDKQGNLISLKGTVVDSTTKEPLIGVNIYFPNNKHYGTVTDFDGNFELKVDNNFPLELVFSYLGYDEITKLISNPNEKINIKLSQSDQLLQGEVVVAGSVSTIDGNPKKETRKYKRKHKH